MRTSAKTHGFTLALLDVEIIAVVALTAAAALIRFAYLARQSFWYDEVVTVSLVEKPLRGMFAALPSSESAPPLYYVAAWVWARLFGTSEFGLRALSALAGSLTIPVAYAAVKSLVARRTAFIVAALASVSPVLVWYSQEARAYALLLLLTALSFLFFVRAFAAPSTSIVAWWALWSSLALCTHYFAVFVIAAETLALLLRHRRRLSVLVATGVITTVGVALLPLVLRQTHNPQTLWIHSSGLRYRGEQAAKLLLLPSPAPSWAGADGWAEYRTRALWVLAAALFAVAVFAAARYGSHRERDGVVIALWVGGVSLVTPFLLSLGVSALGKSGHDVFLARNVLGSWLPLTVVLATGLGARRTGMWGVGVIVVLVAASLAVLVATIASPPLQRDDWRLIASRLQGHGRAIVVGRANEGQSLQHYDPSVRDFPITGARVHEIDLLTRGGHSPPHSLRIPTRFHHVGSVNLQNWRLTEFRASNASWLRPSDLGEHIVSRVALLVTR